MTSKYGVVEYRLMAGFPRLGRSAMSSRAIASSFVFPFVLLLLLAIPAQADPPALEAIPLPELEGGSRVFSSTAPDTNELLIEHPMSLLAGQTKDSDGPWEACVWSLEFPAMGDSAVGVMLRCPPVYLTRDCGALFAWSYRSGFNDTLVVAGGFSYDPMDHIQPIFWSSPVGDSSWTYQQLPTLVGGEGAVQGFVRFVLNQPVLCGWSSGSSAAKASAAVVFPHPGGP